MAQLINQIQTVLLLCPLMIFAQVSDDFSDGNFTSDPTWQGDTAYFKITTSSAVPPEMKPALQLDGISGDTSILFVPNSLIADTEWQFWIKLSFNTSENNYARVYLTADSPGLNGPVNGYYLQFGGPGDSIYLFRQNGAAHSKLLTGTQAFTGNTTNVFRVKVTHDETGFWELFYDAEGGYNLVPGGSCFDNEIQTSSFFGLYCRYTSSNATKFYFDDLHAGEIIIDSIPPEITSLEATSDTTADIWFSEIVDPNTSQEITHYLLDGGLGNPLSAQRDTVDFTLVHLGFATPFSPGFMYHLEVMGIADIYGNETDYDEATFTYYPPVQVEPFDIVIYEIMTDINPQPENLPEAEYLELYNRTVNTINLGSFTLQPRNSASPVTLTDYNLLPGSILIICSNTSTDLFESYGAVLGLSNFSMNNAGTIVLRDPQQRVIHAVSYDESWYRDDEKDGGGWSLEQVDVNQPCTGKSNWMASIDENGGTPGELNSVNSVNPGEPDFTVSVENDTILYIRFSHFMDSITVANPGAYWIDNGIGYPAEVNVTGQFNDTLILKLTSSLSADFVYQLIINDTLRDCSGLYIAPGTDYSFGLPVQAEPYDVVISEIMADPSPPRGLPEYEYIEIFNRTSHLIDLRGWILQTGSTEREFPEAVMDPGSYILLVHEEAAPLFSFVCRSLGFSSLSLTNTGQTLTLLNGAGEVISSVKFDDSWYRDPDKAEGGWSLEQVDPSNPCTGAENWKVSIADEGGTPGSLNSVHDINPVFPAALDLEFVDNQTIKINFNQSMDPGMLTDPASYSLDHNFGNPVFIEPGDAYFTSVMIQFNEPFLPATEYTLTIKNTLTNCTGELSMDISYLPFGIPETVGKSDLVINEVLFNPVDEGADFVEIYNPSGKILRLSDLWLGSVKSSPNGTDTTLFRVTEKNLLIFDSEYCVLTSDIEDIKERYQVTADALFVNMESYPPYNNESGLVILKTSDGIVADASSYTEDMHFPLLSSVEGVSLERINPWRPSNDKTNWHSAAEDAGFATPGCKNSQYSEDKEVNDPLTLYPDIFSPDNDGRDDVLNICYQFEEPGFTAKVFIFDSEGRLVRQLVNNELLGTLGGFSWDGFRDDRQMAGIGIYVVYVEIYNASGNVERYKKTTVLGGN